ncbi:MAG: flagellar basal body rod protein FlgC [Candidatus Margulisbacteria bacterium]|nr:flagellar basal body rod protein FlgC [Candidatus Margulisiibacteriota bacterium]
MKPVLVLLFLLTMSLADVFEVLDISKAGMDVQQQKLETVAENIANLNSTKTTGGSLYKQKKVIINTDQVSKKPYVARIEDKAVSIQKVYDPSNPEADENGYVTMPDYSLSAEMVDVAVTRRMYDANAAVFNSAKQVAQTLMNLGK